MRLKWDYKEKPNDFCIYGAEFKVLFTPDGAAYLALFQFSEALVHI